MVRSLFLSGGAGMRALEMIQRQVPPLRTPVSGDSSDRFIPYFHLKPRLDPFGPVKIYKLAALYIINIKIHLTIKKSTSIINAHININMTKSQDEIK